MAKRYAKSAIGDEAAYQKKLRKTREYLRPDMQVLEFGCGTGSTAITLAPMAGQILAIDYSENMIAIARDKARDGNVGNISFEISGIEEFDPSGRQFGAILGHSILHLLEDKDLVISKVFDLLKPGGVFISTTACLSGKMHFFKPLLKIGSVLGLMPVVRSFSLDELVQSLTEAGFEIDHQWQPNNNAAVFIVARRS